MHQTLIFNRKRTLEAKTQITDRQATVMTERVPELRASCLTVAFTTFVESVATEVDIFYLSDNTLSSFAHPFVPDMMMLHIHLHVCGFMEDQFK
jgi:hypothetical protein